MKITIIKEFETIEAAQAFLAQVAAPATPKQNTEGGDTSASPAPAAAVGAPAAAISAEPVKKPRKPRADAGQPRGPYKTTGEPAAGGGTPPSTTSTEPAPVYPTQSAAPVEAAAIPASSPAVGTTATQAAAADPNKKLTHDDMRAELGRINKVSGLGMAACQQFLADYRTDKGAPVKRISDVPEAEFPRFIKLIDERIARFAAESM